LNLVDQSSLIGRWITTHYADKFARLRALPPQELVNKLFDGLRRVLPITLIAFVPLLALVMKVLYYRRHILYVDHLIFAVHFQSALFLAMSTTWIVLRLLGAPMVVSAITYILLFVLMITVHLSLSQARVYAEKRLMRWGKTALLVFAYMTAGQWVIGPAVLFAIYRM
jgi:hypothetical protein